MTEKRFYLDVSEAYSGILKIIDFGDGIENIYPTSSRPDMEIVVELLNELNGETEELKKEMRRLYNYFEDWFEDEMPPCGFSEMWDNVKEDEKWD